VVWIVPKSLGDNNDTLENPVRGLHCGKDSIPFQPPDLTYL
jgi:hypothetical protein